MSDGYMRVVLTVIAVALCFAAFCIVGCQNQSTIRGYTIPGQDLTPRPKTVVVTPAAKAKKVAPPEKKLPPIFRLKLGMTIAETRVLMGLPSDTMTERAGDQVVTCDLYINAYKPSSSDPVLVFRNGLLCKWGPIGAMGKSDGTKIDVDANVQHFGY